MKLEEKLNESNFSPHIKKIEDIAVLILPITNAYFPTYTDHGVMHSKKVLEIINVLISPILDKLSDVELFYLYCSAWLHDIGMVGDVDPRLMTDYYRIKIRDEHHIRSFKKITEEREKFGFDENQACIIGWICCAHSSKFKNWKTLQNIGKEKKVRLCALAAVLRLADELHLTPERAGGLWSEQIPPTRESVEHFDKHLSVKEVKVENDKITIVLYRLGTIYDKKLKNDIREKICSEFEELKENLKDLSLSFSKIECVLDEEDAPYLSMLIRQEVLWCLSGNKRVTLKALTRIYKHNVEAIERVLRKLIKEGLVEKHEGEEYSLKRDPETFRKVAGIFLTPSLDEAPGESFGFKRSCITFVLSPFVEDCMTDEFVSKILKEWNVLEKEKINKRPNWLSSQDYKHIFQCSPTALRRAIFPETEFTRRVFNKKGEIIMSRDEPLLRFAVLTGLIHDYIRYHEVAPLRCNIKSFKVSTNDFKHFSNTMSRDVLHCLKKAQWGPFENEFTYGVRIKPGEVKNDWEI